MSTPTPDENQPLRDALQRDAARMPKPDFDPALHCATMRRLRALAEIPAPRWRLVPALAVTAAVLLLSAWAVLKPWPAQPVHRLASGTRLAPSHSAPVSVVAAPHTSLLAYQTAANDSDSALFAMLDRDASTLLPSSPPVFRTSLP